MNEYWLRLLAFCTCCVMTPACGGDDDSNKSTAAGACQMVVTGAISGTYACSGEPYVLQIGDTATFIATGLGEVEHPNAGGFGLSAAVDGPPTVATHNYTGDATSAAWAVDFSHVVNNTTEDWKGGGGPIDTQLGGTCSLAITSVTVKELQEGGGSGKYGAHGKLQATLPADEATGAQGTVSVVLTF